MGNDNINIGDNLEAGITILYTIKPDGFLSYDSNYKRCGTIILYSDSGKYVLISEPIVIDGGKIVEHLEWVEVKKLRIKENLDTKVAMKYISEYAKINKNYSVF